MARIFLDVGANMGQTIRLALQPQFKIDKVIAFDPSPICCQELQKRFGSHPKVEIIQKGLWTETCQLNLYNEGSQGGTVLDDYNTTCNPVKRTTVCDFIRASEWFMQYVSPDDEIFLKLNCEGSECDIILDLLSSGEYKKVKVTLIDFDVRKSPSQKHKEEELKQKLKDGNIDNVLIYMGNYRYYILRKVLSQ